jgi:hypothetical protein
LSIILAESFHFDEQDDWFAIVFAGFMFVPTRYILNEILEQKWDKVMSKT